MAMARLGRGQDAAFGLGQLRALGFSVDQVDRLVAAGELARRHRGVLLDARAPIPRRGYLVAALLALDDTAFLSHHTAAALHGLRAVNVRAIEVTVVADHTPRHRHLRVHRTARTPYPDEVVTREGLRCSAVHRMLLELALRAPNAELDRLIAEAARRRMLHLDRLTRTLERHPRHPGSRRLRAALQRYQPSLIDTSGLERDFAHWLATQHPEIPEPQRNVHLADRWEIDFWWPTAPLAVELDGRPYHSLPDDLERDRLKDTWLQRHQIPIVRVTEHRFAHDRPAIADDIHHFLKITG